MNINFINVNDEIEETLECGASEIEKAAQVIADCIRTPHEQGDVRVREAIYEALDRSGAIMYLYDFPEEEDQAKVNAFVDEVVRAVYRKIFLGAWTLVSSEVTRDQFIGALGPLSAKLEERWQ